MSFWIWVFLLAALLFIPASRIIWVLSVRRLAHKTGQALSQAELDGQLRRARLIATVLCPLFSYLFNLSTLGPPFYG